MNPVIKDVIARVSNFVDGNIELSCGIYNNSYSYPRMTNVMASSSNGKNCYGVYNSNSSPSMLNVIARGVGGNANSYGVYSSSGSHGEIRNSIISCEAEEGTIGAIYTDTGASTRVLRSTLFHGVDGPGTISCIGVDNGFGKELNDMCVEITP